MYNILAVAVGGSLGALLRYGLALWTLGWAERSGFPVGTLVANMLGAFLIGVFFQLFANLEIPHYIGTFILTGFMGALTTFSTFGLEAVRLYQEGQTTTAVVYLLLTNVAVIFMVLLGLALMRQF